MKKKIIPFIVLIVVLGIVGIVVFRGMAQEKNNRILLSGNIELTEVNIGFKTAGRLVERTVDEGDPVRKGQILARLDRDQLLPQREREQAALLAARSQLAQSETAVQWQRATLVNDLALRRADLRQTEAHLRELETGSRPQEIQEAKAAVAAAETEYQRAKRDWERAQVLYKNDDISTAQHDQYRSRYQTSAAALKQAQERANLVIAGPRIEQIDAARAQVARAHAYLKVGEANELELKRREEELRTRRAEIEKAQAQLALINSQIADTVAVSPLDGVVLVKSADVGEILAPGTTVLTVGDIEHPWLRGYINEQDLGRVKLGQRAKVSTDSFPGKVYWGRISFISSDAEFTPKQIQTREERVKLVYRIKIDIDNPRHELKSNMPVDAEILLGND